MTVLSSIRATIIATVLSMVVVNPAIKAVYYPLAIQQDRQDAYDVCINDNTLMGYECDNI